MSLYKGYPLQELVRGGLLASPHHLRRLAGIGDFLRYRPPGEDSRRDQLELFFIEANPSRDTLVDAAYVLIEDTAEASMGYSKLL